MALPKLETPSYELILPSTGKKIKYRPFLVKEYKILMTAMESDNEEIHRIITELVDACTYNKLDMNDIPNFDIEYIFLNMRAKSIGETTKLSIQCNSCEHKIEYEMDITKAEVRKTPEHTSKINITEEIILEMRYPKFEEMIDIYQNFKSDKIVDLLCNCIKSVYTKDEVYDTFTKEEIVEFVNGFSKEQFSMLENFFLTMPKIIQHIEQVCPNCGKHNEINLEGLQNFFV